MFTVKKKRKEEAGSRGKSPIKHQTYVFTHNSFLYLNAEMKQHNWNCSRHTPRDTTQVSG